MSIRIGSTCVACQTYLVPKKNSVYVLETFGDGIKPFRIWMADLLECPDCEFNLLTHFGSRQVSEHFESDFEDWLDKVTFTIKARRQNL